MRTTKGLGMLGSMLQHILPWLFNQAQTPDQQFGYERLDQGSDYTIVQYKDLDWGNGDIVRGSLIVGKYVFREICPTDYGGTG